MDRSAPPEIASAASRVAGFALRDILLTRDELGALQAGLIVSHEEPCGLDRFDAWLTESAFRVGCGYTSELARNFPHDRPRVNLAAAPGDPRAAADPVRDRRARRTRRWATTPSSSGRQGAFRRRWRSLVLGVDTVVVLDGAVLGKPADAAEAQTMLGRLWGERKVVSGICLRTAGWEESGRAVTA